MIDRYQDLIDSYLRNKLSEEERAEVERLIDTDSDFCAEFKFHKETKSAFAHQEYGRLKNRLQTLSEINDSTSGAVNSRKVFGMFFWKAVASFLIICSVGIYVWFLRPGDANPVSLYQEYFEPYPNVEQPVTRDETYREGLAAAYSYYEQAEYVKALELFESLSEDAESSHPEILFYKGISAMQLDLNDQAVTLLSRYHNNEGIKLGRQAKWYEALAHLKQKNKIEARALFQDLAKSPGYKQAEALSLLKRY